tara:strand:+ start:944 stop:1585 length:642 start_codon:yes stop_codon:yes gene_type:complete
MATRALIGYLDEDRNFTGTYNHYDGNPEHLGKALIDFYDTDERARGIANQGYISYVDPENGNLEQKHDQKPEKIKLLGDFEEAQEEMAGMVDQYGGDYGYIWYGGEEGEWTMIKNHGIRSMMDQIDDKMSLAASMFGPVDENQKEEMEGIEESYNAKWNEFITENQVIDDQWTVYVKSLINDIRLNGVADYVDFSEDDFKEDFDNYIADKMDM